MRSRSYVTIARGRPIALDSHEDGLTTPSKTAYELAVWAAICGRDARVDVATADGGTELLAKVRTYR